MGNLPLQTPLSFLHKNACYTLITHRHSAKKLAMRSVHYFFSIYPLCESDDMYTNTITINICRKIYMWTIVLNILISNTLLAYLFFTDTLIFFWCLPFCSQTFIVIIKCVCCFLSRIVFSHFFYHLFGSYYTSTEFLWRCQCIFPDKFTCLTYFFTLIIINKFLIVNCLLLTYMRPLPCQAFAWEK